MGAEPEKQLAKREVGSESSKFWKGFVVFVLVAGMIAALNEYFPGWRDFLGKFRKAR